ncbi:halocyanin domain-containing protein [Haloferax namakaokahaiae]|uniref:Halocyanin domain-containing protein n=1 Tax=Haloferax namakaokahaiae TaxID=1748331 RepID=A0ABD5ZG55_9EURY
MTERFSRRTFLRATAASTGLALLAGCTGGASSGDQSGGGNGDESGGDGGESRDKPSFDGWFDRTPNYDGVHDHTGEDSVTVEVGTGNGYLFEPAALKVSPGTTVVWEWTGAGGTHNVQERDGKFESELSAAEGFTFEHTFDETGEYKYRCVPHESLGMVGIVVVE